MFELLAVLLAKVAGLGGVAKAAAATATAVVTMGVAGGATGVLPLPGGSPDPSALVQSAIGGAAADVGRSVTIPVPPTTAGGAAARAATGASVTTPAGSTSARTRATVTPPTVPPAAASIRTVPTIPALPALPTCVANLIPTGRTAPDPTRLVAELPACIRSVVAANLPVDTIRQALGSANLPANVSTCLSAVVGTVTGFTGGDLSGLPQLLSTCLRIGSVPGAGSTPRTRPGR